MSFARTLSMAALAIAPVLFPVAARAQAMPQSLDMTCNEAKAMVNRAGAVVIATGPNLFDRYVRDMSACNWGDVTKPAWIKTKDVAQCPIGYTCWDPTTDVGRR